MGYATGRTMPNLLCAGLAMLAGIALAEGDVNVPRPVEELERELATDPFRIERAEISRPKAQGDITLKADVSFDGRPAYRVKLRRAEPGADSFNNRPRYDLAAYELQKLFLSPAEYVVPATALRMMPLAELAPYAPAAAPTFRGSDEVLVVLQYWLQEVKVIADVYDPAKFEADPVYARHIGQLNVLTWLIEHGDSNTGNFLISRAPAGQRVYSIDNGVAFALNDSDRGQLWKDLRVDRLPADVVERLRAVTREELERRLSAVAEWQLRDGRWMAVPPGQSLSAMRGVREKKGTVQLGLTRAEIDGVAKQLEKLLARVDDGKIKTY
ncbi:MAG: hypothetical protein EHM60_00725 [Lysobacterales bacterium]|nr:MAG: hypothetical protein EHM60_00725 [Xanthomonadales bacterium]